MTKKRFDIHKDNIFDSEKLLRNVTPNRNSQRNTRGRGQPPPFFADILIKLHAGNYPAKVARLLNFSRRKVHYWTKKALKAGLITRYKKDVINLYQLTQKGKEFCYEVFTRCEPLSGRVFRLHNYARRYPVLEEPRVEVDWRKVRMMNWEKQIGTALGLTVEKTTKHLIVYADVIYGRDPGRIEELARDECDRVARYLEQTLQMKLGRGERARKPHWGVKDVGADLLSHFMEITDDVGKIDRSEGLGEIDWFDPDYAKNYLLSFTLLPDLVLRQRKDLEDIKTVMETFGEGMKQHMALIQELRETRAKEHEETLQLIRELRQVVDSLRPGSHYSKQKEVKE